MNPLTGFLTKQNWFQVIEVLYRSSAPRGVRELAELTGMSVAGVHDVLRRLETAGVVQRKRCDGRLFYVLNLEGKERGLLGHLLELIGESTLQTRAVEFSSRVPSALGWIDDTIIGLRRSRASRIQ